MAKSSKKNPSVGSDRQAKIQAAAKTNNGGGANKIVIAAVVAIVAIVAVVGGVIWSEVSKNKAVVGNGNATPAGATIGEGFPAHPDVTLKAGAPTVDLFEDFQCPGCGAYEKSVGSTITEMAEAGDIKLVYHVVNFLDARLGNDGSTKAGNGAFCAAEAGKFQESHDLAYENQPTEGDGWTVDQLKPLAEQAGLSGETLTGWEKCVTLGKYTNYIKAVNDNAFDVKKIKGTPTVMINGEILETQTVGSPELFKAAVEKATKK